MQKYHWPGFKRQLLAELQKQQNSAQFCDTLLQTEGISVPAHSCILAALSPYLSRKLSASASPPSGQKHQLQLQALKAQTLLKLVGLLYSGELEVERSEEKNDILSAACQFGITNLVGDQKDTEAMEKEPQDEGLHCCRDIEEGGCERNKIRKMQDAQVQSDISMGRTEETLTEERSCVSVGTQTVVTDEQADSSFSFSTQSIDSPQEPTSSLFRSTSQTQNTTLEQDFSSASCPPIPGMSVEASSDGASILHQSSDSVTNSTSTSALSNHRMASSSSPYDRLDSPTPHVYGTYQQSSERIRNGKMADSSENTGQQKLHSHRNIMMGAGKDMAKEKMQDHENAGMRSLAKTKHMQQVMEDTQISIKVKLRRRTKGETWEVVNIQNADDTLAVLTSLQEDVSNQKRQQTALTSGTPPLSSVQMDSITTPHTPALQPATTSFTEPTPLHNNTTSDSQTLSSDCFSPNQNDSLEPASVAQTQGPVEDSDEQIEKLLEDIMMGLNILPNLERDPKKSHRLQTSTDQAAATCQIVQTENGGTENGGTEIQMHSGIGAAGCGCYQEFGTQIVISSTEAGIHGCFAQPSCSSLSSSTQQQQCSPQYHCSVTSMGQKDGLNHLGMALFKNQNPKHDVSAAPAITKAFYLSGQKLHYPECTLYKPVQEDQNVLEFLPLTNGNEAHSPLAVSVPCMDELRLRPCLSPLEPSSSEANYQPNLSGPTNWHNRIQPQPALHRPPWLSEDPVSLQYPLSAITHKEKVSGSGSSQDKNCSFWVKQGQKDLKRIPQNGEVCSESGHVNKGKTIDQHNVEKRKTNPRKRKGDLKCKRSDSKGDAAAPKRRKRRQTSEIQEAAGSLANKELKVSDGTKSQINLSVCSVSLSSNNVLAKERDIASSSSNVPAQFAGKPNDLSIIQESLEENPREPSGGIRTRSFLKKSQETQTNTIPEHSSDLKTMVHKAKIENKDDSLPKRKRGRPRKIKPQENPEISNAIAEPKDGTAEKEPGVDNSVSRGEEDEKAETRCKKRKRKRKEEDVVPMDETLCAESTGTTQTDINNNKNPAVKKPKRPRMVSLQEFQKLLKHRHFNTRMSKESRDKNLDKTAGNTENEEIVLGSGCEETTRKTEDDIIPLENTGEAEESRNIFSVTVDQNQTLNKSGSGCNESQQDDARNSAGKGTSLSAEERYSVFSFDVLEEEVEKLAAEAEQPQVDLHEGQACDEAVTDRKQTIDNDGFFGDDSYLPQEGNNMPPDYNLKPQTPKTNGPPPLDADDCQKISGCFPTKEDEGDDDEVEVDVLLFSPDKVPRTRYRETGAEHTDMVLEEEEEEEEDGNEIDVTGDEAE